MAGSTISSALPEPPVHIYTPEQRPPAGPGAMAGGFWKHRDLILQMTRREVVSRYRGSFLGLAWAFIHPLLLLAAYTFAFSYVMKVGRGGTAEGAAEVRREVADFAFYAFAGLILLNTVSDVAMRSPGLMLQNASYVKKVVFPLEIFPFVQLGAAGVQAGMSFLVLVAAEAIVQHSVPVTMLLAPVVVLPLALMVLGMAWLLAALGVFLRDVAQVIGILMMLLMYLSPVFYKMEMIDAGWVRRAVMLNPLTVPVVNFRHVALEGVSPDWGPCAIHAAVSAVVAWAGFWSFQRFRRGFGDVL